MCRFLFLEGMRAFSQDTTTGFVTDFPIPPMQSAPWALSSTNLPTNLQRAVEIIFQTGMADPRGCEYREIEVVVGDVWQASGIALKTHGWVLPAVKGALTNYAIGWNGLVYPLVSKGGPASAENDARAMVPQMTHNMALNNNFGNLRGQAFASEEYCMTRMALR